MRLAGRRSPLLLKCGLRTRSTGLAPWKLVGAVDPAPDSQKLRFNQVPR